MSTIPDQLIAARRSLADAERMLAAANGTDGTLERRLLDAGMPAIYADRLARNGCDFRGLVNVRRKLVDLLELRARAEELLVNPSVGELLSGLPHSKSWEGKSELDEVRWLVAHAGVARLRRVVRRLETIAESEAVA